MESVFTQVKKLCFIASIIVCTLLSSNSSAQVVLTRDMVTYRQDFNSLPASTAGVWDNGSFYFPGWTLNRTYTAVNSILVGTGTSNAGGLYSYGQTGSSERALGAISSTISKNLSQFAWGFVFQNNTGSTITSLTISYTGEQWRSGSSTAGRQATTFWHSQSSLSPNFDLSSRIDDGWTNVPELNFNSIVNYAAAGALNGNLSANRTFLIASIQVNIPQGHYFMLRWKDLNDLDDDHGLAIDDFSLTWSNSGILGPVPMPVEMLYFNSKVIGKEVKLDWATASEKNSSHFEIQRSNDGFVFETIGSIPAKGYSSIKVNYNFTDEEPVVGTSYYRLKQVDLDETFEFSKLLSAKIAGPNAIVLFPTVTDESVTIEMPVSAVGRKLQVYDKLGRVVMNRLVLGTTTNYKLNVQHLLMGNYFLTLQDAKGVQQTLKFIKK